MKKIVYTLAICVSLWSCGGGGGGDTPDPPPAVNTAPTVPTLASPANNALCTDNILTFTWNASTDAESNPITYTLDVSKNNTFNQIAHSVTSTSPSKSLSLEKGVAYYWRVKATDNKNASSAYSSTFQLYTEGVGVSNHLPFSPSLVSPQLNAVVTGTSVTLQWDASDPDTADTLTYDVYVDTVNPPVTKVATSQTPKTYTASLSAATNYYWKVVVKDNHGGQTIGQVWNYKTD